MTALASGNPFGTHFGASDLKARGRSYLRRGLFVSGLLHLALLAALVPLWRSAGEAIIPRTDGTVTIQPAPRPWFLPPPPPVLPPAGAVPTTDDGMITPTIDPLVDLPPGPIPAPAIGGAGVTDGVSAVPPSDGAPGSPPAVADPPEGWTYYDTPPEPISAPRPSYPDWAREAGVAGKVVLHVLVGADGRVHRVVVQEGVTGLSEPAQAAVSRWIFRPARANGKPVPVWVAIPVVFRL